MRTDRLEFYSTPATFSRYLCLAMAQRDTPIIGRVYEPCVGNGAIVHELPACDWRTNDIDTRWPADTHEDATGQAAWMVASDWTVSNPPFSAAIAVVTHALAHSSIGVAMHLRASIHEVLKTGARRTWMADYTPTGILWLPRFAYQRSPTTGKWTTDSVCASWVIWLKDPNAEQFIKYAPERVIDELAEETPIYRARMDRLMVDRKAIA